MLIFPTHTGVKAIYIAYKEITGTLERDKGLKLNDQIEGGVPVGYAGHHIISIHLAQKNRPMQVAAEELKYNINRGSNGIALPTDREAAIETGLPLHNGRHLGRKQLGSADNLVAQELEMLQKDYSRGIIDKSELLDSIGKIEDKVRGALVNNKVRLQKDDPHWKAGE